MHYGMNKEKEQGEKNYEENMEETDDTGTDAECIYGSIHDGGGKELKAGDNGSHLSERVWYLAPN